MVKRKEKEVNKVDKKTTNKKERPLTIKEKAFCREYVKTGNGTQAVYKAGYIYKNDNSAGNGANNLLRKTKIQKEIHRLQEQEEKKAKPTIMSGQEVMEHFSAIARGEEKDQFGLDIGAGDRIKALVELAKRTVDIDNRVKGQADAKVEINLNWKRN